MPTAANPLVVSGSMAMDYAGLYGFGHAWCFRRTATRRRVLGGEHRPRSRAHYGYVGLEALKVPALIALGATALTALQHQYRDPVAHITPDVTARRTPTSPNNGIAPRGGRELTWTRRFCCV
ncbi:hypothetical protein ABZ797_38910 [Streptomyces antimycoticus]|uniref:hypothetical protein n=1 Tax=Streptomyces antimycoticus TaxID=68175 RepID=UPI0034064301